MACDDEVIPSRERIETVTDDADLEEVYNTERQLLYVACTRARDHLLVSGVAPASEFLDDLRLVVRPIGWNEEIRLHPGNFGKVGADWSSFLVVSASSFCRMVATSSMSQ